MVEVVGSQCLSILELLDLRDGNAVEADLSAHVEECPRCRALLRSLPNDVGVVAAEPAAELTTRPTEMEQPAEPSRGQYWTACGADPDWQHVVVVLGKPKVEADVFLVAPVGENVREASDLDFIATESPLGYPHLIEVWNFGTIAGSQVREYRGSLTSEDEGQLGQLYAHVASRAPVPADAPTGVALAGDDDPRRRFRTEERERHRPLYQPLEADLDDEESDEPVLGDLLQAALSGPEWDRTTLAEQAQLSGGELDRLVAGQLSLTDETDVAALARALFALGIDFDQAREPVERTLALLEGGERIASSAHEMPLAARSYADVSEEERALWLFRHQHEVDKSAEAHQRAVDSYLKALAKELDEIT